MAAVWAAEDTLLERDVAIKLLHPQFVADAEFLERFRREARSAARLSHPNIVPIYDVGEDAETHSPFIVMELVDGGNLKDVIRRAQRVADNEIRSIGATLAAALEYAHGRGIIHRDVKPQNVLVGGDGRPRLTDFGIAQAMTGSGLTRTGAVMGSVHYIAPELVRGKPATPQSDLYALGAVLYELATGRVPFDGETDLAVALAHVEGTPAAPRALNAHISPALEATILRALAKAPEQRFLSGAELAGALRRSNGVVSRAAAAEGATQRIPTVAVPPRRTLAAPAPPARRTTRPQRPRGASGGVLALLLAMAAVLVALGAGFFGLATLSREGVVPPGPTAGPSPTPLAPTAAPKPAALPSATPAPAPPTPEPPSPTPVPPSATPVPPSPTPAPPTAAPTPRPVAVPQLRGKTLDQAQAALKAAGLGATVRGVNVNIDKDVVVDQSPDVGSSLPPGGAVTINVGTGSTPVPNVENMPREQAVKTLQNNSFHVVLRTRRDPRIPEGIAIATTPAAGTVIPRNSEVELSISSGR
jgi:hypothetical protein